MEFNDIMQKHLLASVDCNVLECGRESCIPGKTVYHPEGYFENNMALHYVYYGNGEIECKGKVHSAKAGDVFLVPPINEIWYRASKNNPWQYYWIVIHGYKAQEFLAKTNLNADNPILHIGVQSELKSMFNSVVDSYFSFGADDYAVKGYTYLIFSRILHSLEHKEEKDSTADTYIKRAMIFIGNNYWNDIKIGHIASDLQINSNYLGNLFRKVLGKSPKQYLHEVRMSNASRLLVDTRENIGTVAKKVGYRDALYFSKEFRAHTTYTPTEYREKFKRWK